VEGVALDGRRGNRHAWRHWQLLVLSHGVESIKPLN
jgi:hypothetical protein